MTKIIVLGQEPKEEKKLKPIEFVKHYSNQDVGFVKTIGNAREWRNIYKLNMKIDGMDVFFCDQHFSEIENSTNSGNLFLGHFNDGVVE